MINIKIILFLPLLAMIILMLPRFRRHLMSRLIMISITLLGILFIIFPSLSNKLAQFVGVGRGADLIFYLFMVFSFLYGIFIYAKLRMIQQNQTEIVKNLAIREAKDYRQESANEKE